VFLKQPSATSVSGVAFTQQPQVAISDAQGSVVTSATSTITLALKSGSGTLTGCTTSVAAVAGVATFSGCAVTGSGAFTLEANSGGLTTATSNTIAVPAPDTTPPRAGTHTVNWGSGTPLAGKLTNAGWNATDVASWSVQQLSAAPKSDGTCPKLGTFDAPGTGVQIASVYSTTSANILNTTVNVTAPTGTRCVAYDVVAYDAANNRTVVAGTTTNTTAIVTAAKLTLTLNAPVSTSKDGNSMDFKTQIANALSINSSRITITQVVAGSLARATPPSLFTLTGKHVRGTKSTVRIRIAPTKAGLAYIKKHPRLAGKLVKLNARMKVTFKSGSVVTVDQVIKLRFPKKPKRTR
jgi:hypothetical protein